MFLCALTIPTQARSLITRLEVLVLEQFPEGSDAGYV
jgi:hypothetical protein